MGKHRYNLNYSHHNKKRKKQEENVADRAYSNVLTRMIERYEPDGEDWMGFKLNNSNPYTFHHIRERRKGGKEEIENGAILTTRAHQFLNTLDSHYHQAYEDYQTIFRRINKNNGPLDDDLKEDIYGMLLDIFYYNEYHISRDVLQYYDHFSDADQKVKVKKR